MDVADDEFERKIMDMQISLNSLISREEVETSWKEILREMDKPSKRVRKLRTVALLAAACIAFTVALVLILDFNSTFSTRGDEKLNVSLKDGSTVTINHRSTLDLAYGYSVSNRTVYLEGEAFFEVRKDPNSPFKVKLGSSEITVTGTAFNAAIRNGEGEVSVLHGTVSVSSALGRVQLAKGDKVMISADGLLEKQPGNENDFAWYTGNVVINDKSVADIAAMLSRIFDIKIEVSPSVSACRMSVSMHYQSINDVLDIIKDTLNIEWKSDRTVIYIYGKGC